MEMAVAKAAYYLARAEEEVADRAFLEAETLLKRRRAEHTAKMKVTDIMRRLLEDAQQVRIPLILFFVSTSNFGTSTISITTLLTCKSVDLFSATEAPLGS
jgi:hypothetical protein